MQQIERARDRSLSKEPRDAEKAQAFIAERIAYLAEEKRVVVSKDVKAY